MSILKTLLYGATFGIVQIVPGVSGGTIAIILGFYERLLESINNFRKDPRLHLRFLLPFVVGAGMGIVAFATLINFLLENFSLPTMALFIGLIIGIVPMMAKKAGIDKKVGIDKRIKASDVLCVIIPISLLIAISHITVAEATEPAAIIAEMGAAYMLFLFLSGFFAAMGLLLPGISGSFILLMMGVYHVLTFTMSLVWDVSRWFDVLRVMAPFGVGILVGVVVAARLVVWLLKKYENAVYLVILGLLIGSVYALFRNPQTYVSGTAPLHVVLAAVTLILGTLASYFIGKSKV